MMKRSLFPHLGNEECPGSYFSKFPGSTEL